MMAKRRLRRFRGVLSGDGYEASCMVEVGELFREGFPPLRYRADIIWAATSIPNGSYSLSFNGNIDHVIVLEGSLAGL